MKTKSIVCVKALFLAVLILSGCNKNPFNALTNIKTIPDFSVLMDSGETVNALTLFGMPSVICIFDTADSRSVKILSMLDPLHDRYRRKVKFVTISDGEPESDITGCWTLHGWTLPYSAQDDATQARKFSSSVPYLMIIDSNMKIMGSFDRDNLPTMGDIEKLISESTK